MFATNWSCYRGRHPSVALNSNRRETRRGFWSTEGYSWRRSLKKTWKYSTQGKGETLQWKQQQSDLVLCCKTPPRSITTTAQAGHGSLPKSCHEPLRSSKLRGTAGCNTQHTGTNTSLCVFLHGALAFQCVHLQVVGNSTGTDRQSSDTRVFPGKDVYTLPSQGRGLLVT